MTEAMTVTDQAATGLLFQEIQQFYARQMRLLDNGAAEEWADTFTHDGVFHQNVAEPLTGRRDIAVASRKRVDELAGDGITRRHWLGMLEVEPQADGSVRTWYYALSLGTPLGAGARPRITSSTVAEDVLVRDGRTWLVRSRLVSHDGTAQ